MTKEELEKENAEMKKQITKASIARVFGYSAERIRQICADNEE